MLDLDTLNPEQRKAVETTEGAVLVLAGAGSGKTRVLTFRIAYILDSGLAGPDNILAMTFTNKAAGEMKERAIQLMTAHGDVTPLDPPSRGEVPRLSWMGTFHSICVKILKKYGNAIGLDRTFTIYDSRDQEMVIKEAMGAANVSTKEFNPRAIKSYISSAKNELVDSDNYKQFANGYFQQVVAEVYPHYQRILRENNALDFDDLIMKTILLLQNNKDILAALQDQFRYILVDEYQDTNHAQYKLVTMLAAKHKNICCVGDDDQSIYSFRGATIQNILSFEKDYPNAVIVKLEQNYRSTKKILEASHQVIQKNKARRDKKLWTDNNDGNLIQIYTAADEKDEGQWVLDKIQQDERDGVPLSEIAILYRTNAQSRALEEVFIRSNIPYRIVGGVRFYERKEIKDLLAYLKAMYNTADNQSFDRIVNTPRRGMGAKSVAELKELAREQGMSLVQLLINNGKSVEVVDLQPLQIPSKFDKLRKLFTDLYTQSKKLHVVDFINYILERTEYLEMLEDGTSEGEARIENIKELISVASKYIDDQPEQGLANFLEEVSLLEEDRSKEESKDMVTLMTVHAAKGLEFKHVFVVGMEENLFPHGNSATDRKQLEEERRLAYVAITRAKEQLYLTHAKSRMYFGSLQQNPTSRFLHDIDAELTDKISAEPSFDIDMDSDWAAVDAKETEEMKRNIGLDVGDKVKHEYFGVGTIKAIDDEKIDVDFGAVYGVKELMLEYARLVKV